MNATTNLVLDKATRSSTRAPRRRTKNLPTLCREYIELLRAFDASGGECEDSNPAWLAVTEAEDRIYELQPQTMADIMALAKLAEFYARQPDGSMNFSDSYTGQVPERIIKFLLRLDAQGAAVSHG